MTKIGLKEFTKLQYNAEYDRLNPYSKNYIKARYKDKSSWTISDKIAKR